MAVLVDFLVVFLAMAGYSNAAYCICKDGVSSDLLQNDIDYACGGGADCSPIHETGSCYNPNTVKDHCNYAVNSYYQKRNQIGASCDFSGTAMLSPTIPTNLVSGCSYPSSAGSVTPTTNPSIAPPGSSTTPGTVTPTNPATAPPGSINPGTIPPPANPSIIAPPGSTNPITTTPPGNGGTGMPAFGGLGPTAGGFNPDGTPIGSGGVHDHQGSPGLLVSLALAAAVSSWIWFRV